MINFLGVICLSYSKVYILSVVLILILLSLLYIFKGDKNTGFKLNDALTLGALLITISTSIFTMLITHDYSINKEEKEDKGKINMLMLDIGTYSDMLGQSGNDGKFNGEFIRNINSKIIENTNQVRIISDKYDGKQFQLAKQKAIYIDRQIKEFEIQNTDTTVKEYDYKELLLGKYSPNEAYYKYITKGASEYNGIYNR